MVRLNLGAGFNGQAIILLLHIYHVRHKMVVLINHSGGIVTVLVLYEQI